MICSLVVIAIAASAASSDVSGAVKEDTPRLELDSTLAECVTLTLGQIMGEKNLLLLPAKLTVRKSIGYCGCKSGAIRYQVYETYQGRRREMSDGRLNSVPRAGKTDEVIFVLNPDIEISRRPPFILKIACGG
jgi:hypothetical protein